MDGDSARLILCSLSQLAVEHLAYGGTQIVFRIHETRPGGGLKGLVWLGPWQSWSNDQNNETKKDSRTINWCATQASSRETFEHWSLNGHGSCVETAASLCMQFGNYQINQQLNPIPF
jgi:hypothetical protein